MNIRSKTGAIHIRFTKPVFSGTGGDGKGNNEKSPFDRVYNTRIEATTGQVHGELLHGGLGGETVVTTSTGMLDLRITPLSDHPSRIETSTKTGLSKVTIESPMKASTLRNLTAVHKSVTSGMLDVRYPHEWTGKVHVWCEGTGHVEAKGEGLNFQGGGTDVYAWRGNDALQNGKTIEVVSEGTGMVFFKA